MKYVALLRGINVGGNNIIKMLALKEAFEKIGMTHVLTFIQSGNVIFESPEKKSDVLTKKLETMLTKTFSYKARIVVFSHEQLKQVVAKAPKDWKTKTDIRCYVGFLLPPMTAADAVKQIVINEAVDILDTGPGVIYMTTLMSGLTKSGFTKMIGTNIYKEMTIRNLNTTRKLLELMEKSV